MSKYGAQPAVVSYFFGKCYRDVGNTIKGAFSRNGVSIAELWQKRGEISMNHESKIAIIFLNILDIMGIVAVAFFGSIITLLMSALMCVVFIFMMAGVYVAFTFIYLVDHIYLQRHKIFTACNECKEKSLIPTYICPSCGAQHTYLVPSKYGILHRTCECGEKLPTTFFNGRRDLQAICPHCGAPLNDRETVPICIPIVGGRSVGKTAFITAFSEQFFNEVAPSNGWEVEFYNESKERIYNEIQSAYQSGDTIMTTRQTDITKPSAISFSFFVKGKDFTPERLVHVYDIAGEIFTQNSENEVQKQYEYCQGIVLVIDPFAIPAYRMEAESMLTKEDLAGIGNADINDITDSFLNKLREVTGLTESKMASVPLAVVISKIDSADLEDRLGDAAIRAQMAVDPELFSDYYNTEDFLCRAFLKDYGMDSFLESVNMRFKTNRFFACSAIGHTRNAGKYEPEGVLQPMEWLFHHADKHMKTTWTQFEITDRLITQKDLDNAAKKAAAAAQA